MKTLKAHQKLRWTRTLMLASQALLVCFMAYWLRSQYFSEQEELRKDLAVQLEHSQQAISDSMIMATFVKPLQHAIKSHLPDTLHAETIIQDTPGKLPAGRAARTPIERQIIYDGKDSTAAFLTNGIRLMLSADFMPGVIKDRLMNVDTGLLTSVFRRDIGKSGLHITTQWINTAAGLPKHNGLYLSTLGTAGYKLQIGAFNGHLLKQMIPQFLITIFLLSLTTIAFLSTYRSLRAQTHLAAIRNDFISNMSHELKTPVSTVKIALEAISEPEVLQDILTATEYIRMASLEMARLELLINQALQTSLLEEGKMMLQAAPVDLEALVNELLRTIQPRLTQEGATIDIRASGNAFIVAADKLQVQGVVINILDNALKYAGDTPHIRVIITADDAIVSIEICDNGPGIPEAYAERIFDKFFRVPRGNEHSVKGYGLGLSYAAQVMRQHGGSIAMRNNPGGGCSFMLRFQKT